MKGPKVNRHRRKQLSILLITLMWVGAALFTAFTFRAVLSDDQAAFTPTSQDAGPTTAQGSTTTPSPEASTTSGPSPTTPTALAGAAPAPGETPSPTPDGLPTDGPGISAPGVLLVITPSTGGSFDVSEQVRLPSPTTVVKLAPAQVSRAGDQFDDAEPVATAVQLSTDGQPVVVPDGTVAAPVDIPVDGITQFELSYQLDGVTVRSVPSTARRALAAVSPLVRARPGSLPVVVVVAGPVLGVNCPLLTLAEQSCGVGSAPMLQVDRMLPLEDAVVTIQLDLPRA